MNFRVPIFKWSRYVLQVYLLLSGISAQAQSKTVNKTAQQWVQYYFQAKVSEKWSLLADGSYRVKDSFTAPAQYLARLGVGYNLNSTIRLTAGFGTLGYYGNDFKIQRREYRPHVDITFRSKFPKIDISNRMRFEHRNFREEHPQDNADRWSSNYRFRYAFSMSIPLFSFSKSNPDAKFIMAFTNEVFFNAGKKIVYNMFDQNRLMISPTIQLGKNFNIAFTYNYQFAAQNAPGKYTHTDIFWMMIRHNLDLSKKDK